MAVEKVTTPMEVEVKEGDKIDPQLQAKIDAAKELVQKDPAKLNEAVERLLALERVHRLASEAPETATVCVAIVQLCFEAGDWSALQSNIVLLSKRRAQLKQAVTKLVQEAMKYIDRAKSDEQKLEYLDKLRTVTEGKIYVELERARITRTMATMKERAGDVSGACEIVQDMQVETFGSMDRREKTEFILEQVRLCLANDDYIRAGIMSKKVTARALADESIEDLVILFYEYIIRVHLKNHEYLEICRCFLSRFDKKAIQKDVERALYELKLAIFFLLLSKHTPMQQDLLHRVAAYKIMEKLPLYREILKLTSTGEIIKWSLFETRYDAEFEALVESANFAEPLDWKSELRQRISEHNLRVAAAYYSRIRLSRLAELLDLSEIDTEDRITRMVSDEKALWAKIDRPKGIVSFSKPGDVDNVLNNWAGNVAKLLDTVERTCHLMHKESMAHKVQG